ncbi:hypothetical protein CIB48_g8898 [Xylaria polymorpha]|nr:hypothetical protein CIB48_g8898 [Xylaria polymorpha]
MSGGGLQAIRYTRGKLEVLDQLRLPHEHHYDAVSTSEEAFDCIKSMRVRGAPAIAIVAALAHGVELYNGGCEVSTPYATIAYIDLKLDYLKQSRPTAVDLSNAITHLKSIVRSVEVSALDDDAAVNDEPTHRRARRLVASLHAPPGSKSGDGEEEEEGKVAVLTHCNTGSLATSGHGTALGIVRSLHSGGNLSHAFCTETRPYNQGSRLTAFELVYERIPATLITDSMAGTLFATRIREGAPIAAVIVGADRVVRNGDTANKVGTYALAVLARHHGVKFIVAAPTTSIDLHTATGEGIKIEERKAEELTQITGAWSEIAVWNPAFDVTPANLIDAIVTEQGVVVKGDGG